ncbi:unnamed protein product [Rotaria sp. Silwood2]|nr:unnamed protein product [Rotaria sp. Silwood2]CAF2885138.1 unnamed protein product [Rotaria sp. Silwood2]CAF3283164.1 unnamed protein product [Rotaria sp. Silwood2]CAF3383391.1 unnamed protein product [Rotaria sp. Silwood2]CAF4092016.1 unnamed protein product [Rotaria sp. Silwood2]
MNSKNNNKNPDDSPTQSSSAQSPYNLRRNQLQPGAITKRSNSAKSKKDISVATPTRSHSTNSTNSQSISNPVEITSSDDEQSSENNDTSEMERSDEEQEITVLRHQAHRQENKPPSVWSFFDYLDDNIYMCQICFKVSKYYEKYSAYLNSTYRLNRMIIFMLDDIMF